MATAACKGYVGSGKRERCFRVIEGCAKPIRRAVAYRAIGRKSSSRVVRVCRCLEVLAVARIAIHGRTGKSSIHVTLGARDRDMCAGERERGGAVIER